MKQTRKNKCKNNIFSESDYNSGDGMLTSVWGPSLWHYLHTMSFNYPVNPTIEEKQHYLNFIKSLQYVLPCKYCRMNLTKNFKQLPITMNTMKNRESFSYYIYSLHELVNKMLNKKSNLTYCDVKNRYEHFRSRCSKDINKMIKPKTVKNTKKETGCNRALYGKKSKCIIKIVPQQNKSPTFQIDKQCITSLK
jgi:hypothetical protein